MDKAEIIKKIKEIVKTEKSSHDDDVLKKWGGIFSDDLPPIGQWTEEQKALKKSAGPPVNKRDYVTGKLGQYYGKYFAKVSDEYAIDLSSFEPVAIVVMGEALKKFYGG